MRFLHGITMIEPSSIANIKVELLSLKKSPKSDSFYRLSLNLKLNCDFYMIQQLHSMHCEYKS